MRSLYFVVDLCARYFMALCREQLSGAFYNCDNIGHTAKYFHFHTKEKRHRPLKMKRLLLILLLLPVFAKGQAQNSWAGKFWIYNYPHKGGLLRGDVKKYIFSDAEKKDSIHVPDIAGLNKVIGHAKVKRSIQAGKLGANTRALFCGALIKGEYHRILICNNDLVIDFTDNRDYSINDLSDQHWLDALGEKMYKP